MKTLSSKFKIKESGAGKITLIILCMFLLIITCFAGNIPFFWNMVRYSELAHYYIETNFTTIMIPKELDNGNPPFYGLYLALIWKLFGKSLLISHLSFYPFILGLFWQFYLMCRKYLSDKYISIALILLAVEPTVLTQSLLMGYDIILMFLFLLGINQLTGKRHDWLLVLSALLMSMISLRGIMMSGTLILIQIYLNKEKYQKFLSVKQLVPFIPAFLFLVAWYGNRYLQGSPVFSSYNNPEHREWVSINRMIRNCVYIAWKILDFGRVGLILLIIFSIIRNKINKIKIEKSLNQLLLISSIIIFCFSVIMVPVSNPVSHPYFLILFGFLILIAIKMMHHFHRRIQRIIYPLLIILLISGNFWIYPLRFGNGWDASLKILPWFSLYEKMKDDVTEERLNPQEIGTAFPVYTQCKYTFLSEEDFSYADKGSRLLYDFKYILHSNVINTFTPDELRILEENWDLIKIVHSGQVYMRLYENRHSQ